MHLPSPEILIKEKRCQVPTSQFVLYTHSVATHTSIRKLREHASLIIKIGFFFFFPLWWDSFSLSAFANSLKKLNISLCICSPGTVKVNGRMQVKVWNYNLTQSPSLQLKTRAGANAVEYWLTLLWLAIFRNFPKCVLIEQEEMKKKRVCLILVDGHVLVGSHVDWYWQIKAFWVDSW